MALVDPAAAVRFAVAHLYQRSGRRALSENELVNAMSLDLKWYPPKDARHLVAALAREGHLRRTEDGELEPTRDVREVKVPLGFRPPPDLARGVPESTATQEPTAETSPRSTAPPAGGDASPHDAPPSARDAAAGGPAGDDQGHDTERSPTGGAAPAPAGAPADADDGPTTDLGALLDALAERTGEGPGDWVRRMDAVIQSSADTLTPEAALLLAAAARGVDVRPWIGAARAAL